MDNEAALKMLSGTTLSPSAKSELYEMYLEDLAEYSEGSALEKLETGISDSKGE